MSLYDLTIRYGADEPTVRYWLGAYSISPGPGFGVKYGNRGKTSLPALPTEEIKEKYVNGGMSCKELAEEYGISFWEMRRRLTAAGLHKPCGVNAKFRMGEDELRRLYIDEGVSTADIADAAGVNRVTVQRRLKKLGISRRPYRYDAPDKEELLRAYEEKGMSVKEMAAEYGVSAPVVARWMEWYGMPRSRRKLNPSGLDREGLRRMREEGMTMREIALRCGVSHTTVKNRLKEYGLE